MHADLLGYLTALGVPRVLLKLTIEERTTGSRNLIGSLPRLEKALQEAEEFELLQVIKKREKVNGERPFGDHELASITEHCADKCYEFLRNT